jgi:hypothetical protein
MLTLLLPEAIGNVTGLTARNRVSAFCLEESDSCDHTNPLSRKGIAIAGLKIIYQLSGEPLCRKNVEVAGKIKRNLP